MCRSANDSAGPRRCKCDNDDRRRDRQNLAYSVKTEEAKLAAEERQNTIGDGITTEERNVALSIIHKIITDKDTYVSTVSKIREEKEKFDSDRAWILNGREDTPENYALGLDERAATIQAVGEIVSARSAFIHGINLDAERERREQEIAKLTAQQEKLMEINTVSSRYFIDTCEKHGVKTSYKTFGQEDEIAEEHFTAEELARYEELQKESLASIHEQSEVRRQMRALREGEDEEAQRIMAEVSAANKKAVAEARSVGGVPVIFDPKLRKDKDAIITQVNRQIGGTFPDDWIQKSNDLGPLEIRRTQNRAHYRMGNAELNLYNYSSQEEPIEGDARYEGWRKKLDEDGNFTGKWEGPLRDVMPINGFAMSKYRKKFHEDGSPKGEGWRKGMITVRSGGLTGTRTLKEFWVRDNPTDAKKIQQAKDGIGSVNLVTSYSEEEQDSIIVHEFAHRVEDSNPIVGQFEQHWIAKRTTNEDGTRQPLKTYISTAGPTTRIMNGEKVRTDDFVESYVGKEYKSGRFHELLSMGSEALFNGQYGGFEGIGHVKSDRDSKSYILGMYSIL